LGPKLGIITLQRVIDSIPDGIPVLLDVKMGDIGSTASAYADSCYELKADGVTLSPLMGWDSVSPFISGKYISKGAFLLCKTSNPGSNDLLNLKLSSGNYLYEQIATLSKEWSSKVGANCLGLVVGATDTVALENTRKIGDDIWILAPGIGAQGANLEEACRAGLNSHGSGLLLPMSREISRASDPGAKALELKEQINAVRSTITPPTSNGLTSYQEQFLNFCLEQSVLKFGSFTLKSGRTSPYFFNAGAFSTGSALHKLGKAYAAAIMSSSLNENGVVKFDVIFGPAYKGISLGALVSASLYSDFNINVGFTYNRKEAKDHGEGGVLVGSSIDKQRILVVDDVITAGTAIRESHALLTKSGGIPIGVVIALDRAEKKSLDEPLSAVQSVEKELGIPVVSIVSLPQLQSFLEMGNDGGGLYDSKDALEKIVEYRRMYGV